MTRLELPFSSDYVCALERQAAQALSLEAAISPCGQVAPLQAVLSAATLPIFELTNTSQDGEPEGRRPGESERDYVTRVYGVHVVEIWHGSNLSYSVFKDNQLIFTTTDRNLEQQLRRHGVHPLNALFGNNAHREHNYLDYLQNQYNLQVVTVYHGPRLSYQAFIGGRRVETSSLVDLQREVEARAARPAVETAIPLVVRLPNGNSIVHFPDRSCLTLDRTRSVVNYTDSRGNLFTRISGPPQESWQSALGTWNGAFTFSNGRVSFAFREDAARLSLSMHGNGRIEESFRDGRRAVYNSGRLISYSDREGTIELERTGATLSGITIQRTGEATGRRFSVATSGALSADGASHQDLADAHSRLAEVHERLGLRPEALRQRTLAVREMENLYTPGDTRVAAYHDHVVRLATALGMNPVAQAHRAEAQEIRRVASYLDEIHRAGDPAAVTATIIGRLPERITVESSGARMQLATSNLLSLLEAIPGFRTSELSALNGPRTLTVEEDRVRLSGRGTFSVADANGGQLTLSLNDLSGRLRLDPRDHNRVVLTDVTGLAATQMGAQVNLRELSFALREDNQGHITLVITPTRLQGAAQPQQRLGNLYNQFAAGVATLSVQPVEIPLGHRDDTPIPQLFNELRGWARGNQPRDAGRLVETIGAMYMDRALAGILGGVRGIERNGEQITIRSNGSDAHNLGGLPIHWDETVRARMRTEGNRLSLTNIEGLRIRFPLPTDVADSLGMRNPLDIAITELSLSEPDRDGNRTATMRTAGALESVSIKVGPQMQPVTDRNGNAQLTTVLNQGGRIPLELTFNPQQVAAADLARMDFRLLVRENHNNIAGALERLLGCELNDTLQGVLNGVESIERRGNTVTIRRRAATAHELGGLGVSTAREVSFTLHPRNDGVVQVTNITGVDINRLPGFANSIYRTRLPIPIQSVTLGAANRAGERTLSISGSGALREAVVRLDSHMTPQNILVEVVNPVQAFIDSAPNTRGRDQAIQSVRDRLRGTNTYVMRISANGDVDFGGLGALSSMFSNAGDFLSFEGFLAAGIGHITGDRSALPNAAIRTWNTLRLGPLGW